jgi:hypothetical protein
VDSDWSESKEKNWILETVNRRAANVNTNCHPGKKNNGKKLRIGCIRTSKAY